MIKIIVLSVHSGIRHHALPESYLIKELQNHSIQISYVTCGETFSEFCHVMPESILSLPKAKKKVCNYCNKCADVITNHIGSVSYVLKDHLVDDDYFDIIVCLRLFQRIPSETRLKILSEFQRTSTKNLIISYSYTSSWQQIGTMIKNFFIKRSELLFTENLKIIERELNQFGFKVRDKKTVLSFLSSEIIILAENK